MTDSTNDTQNPSVNPEQRRIKSFVLRQGRMSQSQQRAMDNNWPKYGLEVTNQLLDLNEVFGREAPTIVEIGFGMGKSLAEMAEANPQQNYIGIEVHRPGVGALLKLVEEKALTNVRVFNHDAIEVLEKRIPKSSLAAVYLFFPDPWHKKRHNKRRIVQPQFVKTIAGHLKKGGHFHMATDWEDYAEHMMEVMNSAEDFQNTQAKGKFTPRPDYRPLTKFEQRGHRLGHGVWDLIFEKISEEH
ncbi:tRNA (guanosine(46)-N7)-methyltransferase TrmB [Thiomicrorhabdus sp. ZW0627]|uniref:tRNA (guanosine(46)-N7)-methyltransferase TrmB n=1 Tax=Thiomicrorhabdus sp. ZW0627 TaxID=3039774 RepID=UPI0024366E0B|nr:tRNA (guanosine(46)-N7)-methyltransferase TrmB [Thiomicrorhabdus sp. ZW0627]MDG6774359.1 tRNA (guanosine(46)-N7)-methyltransferase TrmB [Thiomicrorhabdus sp. ZW0627]